VNIRTLANILLAATIVVLAAYLFNTETPVPASINTGISATDPASIRQIRISRPGKPDIEIVRSGDGWIMTRPLQVTANPFRISSILELLQTHSLARLNADVSDLDRFGLMPAAVILTLDDQRFHFGNVNPLDHGRYLMHGQTIHVIEDTLYYQLVQDAGFFVNPRVLPSGAELTHISHTGFELNYRNGRWEQSGGNPQLPLDDLLAMADAWAMLEATTVVVTLGQQAKEGEILLGTSEGLRIALSTRLSSTELVLSRSDQGIEYHFPAQTARTLGISPEGGN